MANHCEDVTCQNCGETWCSRECGARYSTPDWRTYHLHKLAVRMERTPDRKPEPTGLRCEACGSREVFMN